MGDSHVGLQARLMSQALRKLSGAIKHSNTAMIFTNQLHESADVQQPGTSERRAGAEVLRPACARRPRIQALKQGGEVIGNRTRVRVTRTRSPPLPAG